MITGLGSAQLSMVLSLYKANNDVQVEKKISFFEPSNSNKTAEEEHFMWELSSPTDIPLTEYENEAHVKQIRFCGSGVCDTELTAKVTRTDKKV